MPGRALSADRTGTSAPPSGPSTAATAQRARDRPRDMSSRAAVGAVAAAVFVLAVGLRLWHLQQSYELFIDEVTYVDIARSLAAGEGVLLHGNPFYLHPPAFFGSLALVMDLTGTGTGGNLAAGAFALRPVSAVLGALTPALVSMLLHRVTRSWIVAAGGGLLLAVEPFLIRFDSRVLLEAQAMAAATGGVLVLLALHDRDRRGDRVLATAILAGLLMLASLLTKETYTSVTVLPVVVLLVTGLVLRRRTAAIVLVTTLGGYATYVMALVLAGQGDNWFLQKTRGVRRVLGLTQATGFNREGSVSLVSRVLANLSNFAMTYAVIGSGLLATLWLLHRLRRGDVPGSARAAVVLLVVWSLSATANLAYAVTLGTLEEQMFYLLVVTAVPVVFVAAHAVHPRGRRLRAALIVGLALALATNASVWSRTHTVPDDGYARFLGWAQTGLPRDSTVAATDETSQFVLPQAHVLRLTTGNELRTHHADYVLVVSVLVEQGYSDVDREFLDIVGRGRVVFRSTGPTSGDLTLYDVSGVTG